MLFDDPTDLRGRILDGAVHEDGFGRHLEWEPEGCGRGGRSPCDAETHRPVPDYSGQDWHLVLDRLRELGYRITIQETVRLDNGLRFGVEARAETRDGELAGRWRAGSIPEAVCRLALSLLRREHAPPGAH